MSGASHRSRWEDPGHILGRAPQAVTIQFDGEAVVYHLVTGEVHRLDSVGSIVWQLLDGQCTVGELVEDLSGAFEVDPSVVRGDLSHLFERLERGLLFHDSPEFEERKEATLLTNPPSP